MLINADDRATAEDNRYLLDRWSNSMRVVFSMDFTKTLVLGVIGEFASLRGLKLRTAFRILLDVLGRVRISTDSVFRVASTSNASLGKRDEMISR